MYSQILKTIIFLQIVFLSFTINYLNERKTCKHLQTEKGLRHFLLFHHFIAILLHWKFNDNRCLLSYVWKY